MEETIDKIVNQLSEEVVDKTIIEGGAYDLEYDLVTGKVKHLTNKESSATFEAALALYSQNKDKEISISFIIDDLKVPKNKRQEFKEQFKFPKEYLELMKKYDVKAKEFIFTYESTLRNRADYRVKKAIKKGNVANIHNIVNVMNPEVYGTENMFEVSNETGNTKRPVPNCRMILAQQLQDKEFKGYKKAINICNSDVYNCQGSFAKVYQLMLNGTMEVVNTYIKREDNKIITETKKYK